MNPFDLKAALLARHAQHVVLIHFPIALSVSGVAFDVLALWRKSSTLAAVAYYNLLAAAVLVWPALVTGILAWQLQLGGKTPRGNLRLHLFLALSSAAAILLVWFLQFRTRTAPPDGPLVVRLAAELVMVLLVTLTGHVGGFLSGVNGSG